MDGQPGSLSSGFASSCQLVYSRWMSLEMDVAAIKKLDVRHLYYSCTSVTLHIVEFFFSCPPLPTPAHLLSTLTLLGAASTQSEREVGGRTPPSSWSLSGGNSDASSALSLSLRASPAGLTYICPHWYLFVEAHLFTLTPCLNSPRYTSVC